MYDDYLWLIVLCGGGVASCITYIVCLLAHDKRQRRKEDKQIDKEERLVINLDD